VTVGSGGDKLTANKNVEQRIHVLNHPGDKWEAFLKLIEPFKKDGTAAAERVIIFCNTKKDVNGIGQHCWDNGFSVDTCSGDRSQVPKYIFIYLFTYIYIYISSFATPRRTSTELGSTAGITDSLSIPVRATARRCDLYKYIDIDIDR